MTEKELQLLGFERQIGDEDAEDWYYYTYTVARGFEFITNDSDDAENDEWYVEFFESDPAIRFYKFEEVQALINKLEKHVVKK